MAVVVNNYKCNKCDKILGREYKKSPYCEPRKDHLISGMDRIKLVRKISRLRKQGENYESIALQVGVSQMSAWILHQEESNLRHK